MVFTNSINHPNEFSLVSGKTQLVKEIDSINQSLRLLFTTAKGELFGDPYFGCNLYSLIYEHEGEVLNQMIKDDIVKTATEQESRVTISDRNILIEEDQGTLKITIGYQIRYTNYQSEVTILVQKRKEEDY